MENENWYTFNPFHAKDAAHHSIPPWPKNIQIRQVPIYDPTDKRAQLVEQRDELEKLGKRNTAQQQAITTFRAKHKSSIESFFSDDETDEMLKQMFSEPDEFLEWAYKCYKVKEPFILLKNGNQFRICQDYIYLFNVLVAFEWEPGQQNLAVLEAAARRASDFLFDVTDGWMAFGQVIIGGPELLDCADVQIMASNRLHPRAWVGGLHQAQKYMPIRLGRGVWQKNYRVSVPWDEPEGYRLLVHEWAHYAMELVDSYTEVSQYTVPDVGKEALSLFNGLPSTSKIVVPAISQPVESIMARLEGTSELMAHEDVDPARRKEREWTTLIEGYRWYKSRFPRISKPVEPLEGPLPLRDLPYVVRLNCEDALASQPTELILPYDVIASDIQQEHCWVYLLSEIQDGLPGRILAQGTLDMHRPGGFRLFGARANDEVVLIGTDIIGREKVLCATIEPEALGKGTTYSNEISSLKWHDCTPGSFPIIDVVPEKVSPADRSAKVKVYSSTLAMDDGRPILKNDSTTEIYVFPVDGVHQPDENAAERSYSADRVKIQSGHSTPDPISLDGHVLVRWPGTQQQVIVTFSQGGGPGTGSPSGPPPMTAGSSEGNLMIFFADQREDKQADQQKDEKYNNARGRVRIVTTRLVAPPVEVERGGEPRSYAFSLGSNAPLPLGDIPSLVLAYDKNAELDNKMARICRYDERSGKWQPITSYRPRGAWYVAIPLDPTTAPNLFLPEWDKDNNIVRVERYRLYVA